MSRTLQDVSDELLCCAEGLLEAAGRGDLNAVESLLQRKNALLCEMRQIDLPGEALTADDVARIRDFDRQTGEKLREIRREVAKELGQVRDARRTASEASERSRPSRFVSTRC